jgi:hypothetical protein
MDHLQAELAPFRRLLPRCRQSVEERRPDGPVSRGFHSTSTPVFQNSRSAAAGSRLGIRLTGAIRRTGAVLPRSKCARSSSPREQQADDCRVRTVALERAAPVSAILGREQARWASLGGRRGRAHQAGETPLCGPMTAKCRTAVLGKATLGSAILGATSKPDGRVRGGQRGRADHSGETSLRRVRHLSGAAKRSGLQSVLGALGGEPPRSLGLASPRFARRLSTDRIGAALERPCLFLGERLVYLVCIPSI